MKEQPISQQERRRWRVLVVFQIAMYGYLITMFLIQLHMYSVRDW